MPAEVSSGVRGGKQRACLAASFFMKAEFFELSEAATCDPPPFLSSMP